MVHFSSNPPVPEHDIHGKYNVPERYVEKTDTINYSMVGPMIDSVNDDVDIRISVSDYPTDALIYLYRTITKVNNNIILNGNNPRWESMSSRLIEEIKDRGIDIPNTELTHQVTMTKEQAMNTHLKEVPAILKIGSVPEDSEYGISTLFEDMAWEVLTTKSEANYIQNNFEDITVDDFKQ